MAQATGRRALIAWLWARSQSVADGYVRAGKMMTLGMTILRPAARSPEKGAKTLVWLATSPAGADVSGVYFFDQGQTSANPGAQDTDTGRRLWEISERQCAIPRRNTEPRS